MKVFLVEAAGGFHGATLADFVAVADEMFVGLSFVVEEPVRFAFDSVNGSVFGHFFSSETKKEIDAKK
jgi:hypothetical protein